MIVCGIKLTHDGSIAVVEDNKLKFCIEIEKVNNNPRYSSVNDLSIIEAILLSQGLKLDNIDKFIVDGWHSEVANSSIFVEDKPFYSVAVNKYHEQSIKENVLTRLDFDRGLKIGNADLPYSSYMHVAGHIMSAYCSSPFSSKNESSYILVWDGGQYPRLYYFNMTLSCIENLGNLFFLNGRIYSIIGQYFGPYKKSNEQLEIEKKTKEMSGFYGGLSIAGKIMSYIALGKIRRELVALFHVLYKKHFELSDEFEHTFMKIIKEQIGDEYSDEDVLASFHVYIEETLIKSLKDKVDKNSSNIKNICFTGGCALNIKWNSAVRESEIFDNIWVPPFPNDSGSAIGVACCAMFDIKNSIQLKWDVYSGPDIIKNKPLSNWTQKEFSLKELAELLFKTNEPVVFLNGKAELGPRALGNRSILSVATSNNMKDKLNHIKKREKFRPVAPICMEEYAVDIFSPGCHDPYMLYDHSVKDEWQTKVPAICHLDQTARLQTVNKSDNPEIYNLLAEYYKLSGVPLLCNTSANLNGSGFFPDILSVTKWEGCKYIWNDNVLYFNEQI